MYFSDSDVLKNEKMNESSKTENDSDLVSVDFLLHKKKKKKKKKMKRKQCRALTSLKRSIRSVQSSRVDYFNAAVPTSF